MYEYRPPTLIRQLWRVIHRSSSRLSDDPVSTTIFTRTLGSTAEASDNTGYR